MLSTSLLFGVLVFFLAYKYARKQTHQKGEKYVSKLAILAVLLCGKLGLDQVLHVWRVVISCTHTRSHEDLEHNCMSLCGVSGVYISGPPFPPLL